MRIWINTKKLLYKISKYVYTPLNLLVLKVNDIKCGKKLCTRGILFVYKHGAEAELSIGNFVNINSSRWSNPIGCGDRSYFQIFKTGNIKIGDHVGISNTAFSSASSIIIGNNVMIGSGCKIYDTDFHSIDLSVRGKGKQELEEVKSLPIKIEDNAFIGAGSFILKGVTVGTGSVIGAGSVVTKDVPSGEVWAGNPAQYVKKVKA